MIGCFNILNPKFSATFFLWDLCLFFQLSRGGSGEGSGVVVNRDYFVRFFVNFLRWFLNFFIFRRGGGMCGLKFNHEYVNALETFFLKNQLSDYLLALKREGWGWKIFDLSRFFAVFSRWILYFFFNRRISNVLFLTQKKFDFGVESQKKNEWSWKFGKRRARGGSAERGTRQRDFEKEVQRVDLSTQRAQESEWSM